MEAAIKSRWVEALRSGRYQQGRGSLRPSENTYCCLGVLCDLIKPSWEYNIISYDHATEGAAFPSECFMVSLGLPGEAANNLAEMNDAGVPFALIADEIERSL